MCGIAGFTWEDRNLIEKITQCSAHRGPDNTGYSASNGVSLGHNRLAIIGPSPDGHQPMTYEHDGNHVQITYNGEIYNYTEIKKILSKQGYSFTTNTDTEVVCAAYLAWGKECLAKFNGMWSFALHDLQNNEVFISRDRLGIKPLFYTSTDKGILFASEIKSLLRHPSVTAEVNEKAISHFLMFRNVLGNITQYKGVNELLPGHNLIYDLDDNECEVTQYWELEVDPEVNSTTLEEGVEVTKSKFREAVDRRLVSDVGVGAILSGGLDSSTITGYMDELQSETVDTYTVRFDSDNFDEGEYAQQVSEYVGTNHTELEITFDEFIEAFEEFAAIKDIPIGVPNEIALYLLSEKIRDDGNYVVLSGEGADELFHGYSRIFRSPFDYERLETLDQVSNPIETLQEDHPGLFEKYGSNLPNTFVELFIQNYTYWSPNEARGVLEPTAFDDRYEQYFYQKYNNKPYDNYRMVSYLFTKIHLPILLNRADNATMGHAVESRVPFLDHELAELAISLPTEVKSPWRSINDFKNAFEKTSAEIAEVHDEPKYPIKQAADGYIPEDIIHREKRGFPVPFLEWKDDLIKYVLDLINDDDSHIKSYIQESELEQFIIGLENPENNYQVQQLWMLASIELWLRNWT